MGDDIFDDYDGSDGLNEFMNGFQRDSDEWKRGLNEFESKQSINHATGYDKWKRELHEFEHSADSKPQPFTNHADTCGQECKVCYYEPFSYLIRLSIIKNSNYSNYLFKIVITCVRRRSHELINVSLKPRFRSSLTDLDLWK